MSAETRRMRVLVLAGGQSEEHEVSLASAKSVLAALPQDQFDVDVTVISKQGRWLPAAQTQVALMEGSAPSGGELMLRQAPSIEPYDVVFPILHGPNGEDGTVQGLFKLAGIPCVGSGVLGSAVCMDKVMAKLALAARGIPQVDYRLLTRVEQRASSQTGLQLAEQLGFPLFVKPANMGSSVGITHVKDPAGLPTALDAAFALDRRVILEASASRPGEVLRELEVGILGNDDPQASQVGELTFSSEFYDYRTKYTPGLAEMHIPADIPAHIATRIRELALEAFLTLDCAGLARIDFFWAPESDDLFLNELNTMPGFTATSMYPKLFEAAGLPYSKLVERLIELALERR